MVSGVERLRMECDCAVLYGDWVPWAIGTGLALAAVFTVFLLHGHGVIGQRANASGNIFFGTLAAGLAPRAIPGVVQLRLDGLGMTIRTARHFDRVQWLDVLGPFAVTTRPVRGVTFTRRNVGTGGPPFSRITLYDTYSLTFAELADTLNIWRDRSLVHQASGHTG